MHPQAKIEDSESSPSFSCYSSASLTSRSIAKVIREEQAAAQFLKINDVEDEFSFALSDEDASVIEIDSRVFPVFNRDLLTNDEVDHENKVKDDEIDVTNQLRKLFVDDPEESSSYSSSEVDELENLPSGTYCVWRPKAEGGSSPVMSKCKKSSSTGSGSKRWRFRYLLRRSNSEGKEPMVLLAPKKADSSKLKRNSGEVLKVASRWTAQTPVHEQFYVQRRAENEIGKRKSYLPYRKDLVGLFGNVNGMGKMLPF
ncbi:hypothetical protein L1987_68246 [Smallanthus sonchifolius]|uniref:Uncharacterized protein n=1 Tax=Smallanthus sonchifolius TaxID=185202 RepID=A0ACB9B8G7_9ASTR|nr:hypothetical protein L1987_68246 [Smallanthus sonchifolius]